MCKISEISVEGFLFGEHLKMACVHWKKKSFLTLWLAVTRSHVIESTGICLDDDLFVHQHIMRLTSAALGFSLSAQAENAPSLYFRRSGHDLVTVVRLRLSECDLTAC
jgi:hypothetical protein